jgi:hypothetical protein
VLQHLYADSRPVVKLKTLAAAKFFQLTDTRGGDLRRRDETSNSYERLCDGTRVAMQTVRGESFDRERNF